MAQSIESWLANFIETELRAVIAWREQLKRQPQIKPDPDIRFSDDGSNFRSLAGPVHLPPIARVQLRKVISDRDPAVIWISDGSTQIQATLSGASLAALETGLTGKLDMDVQGDVFSIRQVTVISTPYGPSDGFVQLRIDAIEYHHHLRKAVGSPISVSEHSQIARLIQEITAICLSQSNDLPASDNEDAPAAYLADAEGVFETQANNHIVTAAKGGRFTKCSAARTQAVVASQIPAKRKAKPPSLDEDGFEVTNGINLDRPNTAAVAGSTGLSPGKGVPQATTDPLLLLGLLGRGKGKAPATSPKLPPEKPKSLGLGELNAPVCGATQENSGRPRPAPQSIVPSGVQTVEKVELRYPLLKKPAIVVKPHVKARIPYGRRKIPANQRRLLDQRTSWQPPLPGLQFTQSNVPIDLLERWNSMAFPAQSPAQVEHEQTADNADEASLPDTPGVQPDDAASSSDSSDEAIGDWSPTQPTPKQEQLPPDSSVASRAAGSQSSPYRLPLRSLRQQKHSAPLPTSTPHTLVQATQMSLNGDDIELSVPRALQDPSIAHRQRRKEFLSHAARKRHRLNADDAVADCATPYLTESVTANKAMSLRDGTASKAGMAHAVKDALPESESLLPKDLSRYMIENEAKHTDATTSAVVSDDVGRLSKLKEENLETFVSPRAPTSSPAKSLDKQSIHTHIPIDITIDTNSAAAKLPLSNVPAERKLPNEAAKDSQNPSPCTTPWTPFPQSSFWELTADSRPIVIDPPNPSQAQSQHAKDPSTELSAPGEDEDDEDARSQEMSAGEPKCKTVFEDFAHKWKLIRPGGAFARRISRSKKREEGQGVDVLAWIA